MNYRELGRTGWKISEISFGAWAIGGFWGDAHDSESLAALHRAVDLGVNFIDTADVYGDGRSERLIARLRKERSETIYVATTAGRRLTPPTATMPRTSRALLKTASKISKPIASIFCSFTLRPPTFTIGLKCLTRWMG